MIEEEAPIRPVDVVLEVSAGTVELTAHLVRRAGSALRPVARTAFRPPLVPDRLQPRAWLEAVSQQGEARRTALRGGLSRRVDELLPVVLAEVLRRVDLTGLVLRFVDLDRVVAAVDLDAAAARLDVWRVVERVDVDAVVARADVEAVLDRLDLTAVVLERVDLGVLAQAVLDRIDLVAVAAEVIEGVDLPEIIRESTGSMASDTVRGVRRRGIAADEAVSRTVDRLLLRREQPATDAPAEPRR